jgi:nuclear protein localization family protein 4
LSDLFGFSVFKDRSNKSQIPLLERKTLNDYGLKHGDFVYVVMNPSQEENNSLALDSSNNRVENNHNQNCFVVSEKGLVEDEVDLVLYSQKGLIDRPPDPKTCRHGLNAKCVHCVPIEPYDENYLREHNIKHMSFHTYLKKLTNGIDK